MFGHGGGGWTDLPRAVMIVFLDFAKFGFRLFVAAQSSMCAMSANHDLELAAGTTRCVSSAYLKMRFADVTGWKSAAINYDVRRRTQCRALYDTGLYFRDRRALTIESRTVIMLTKEIVYPVVDIVWYY